MSLRRTDDRAVTVPMNYVLMMGIVALLAVVLVAGTGAYVGDQQERTARAGLEVVGNRIASDLATADRLAGTLDGSGPDSSVELTTDLPADVAGTTYRVEIVPVAGVDYEIVLTTTDPEVSVTVPVRLHGTVAPTSFEGGRIVTTSDGTGLEVRRA